MQTTPYDSAQNKDETHATLGSSLVSILEKGDREMRASSATVRLKNHRAKYNATGKRGALLSYASLTKREQKFIQDEILKDIRISRLEFVENIEEDDLDYDHVLAETLTAWGIMCPHNSLSSKNECHACGAMILVTDPCKQTFGEYIVSK